MSSNPAGGKGERQFWVEESTEQSTVQEQV